MLDAWPDPVVSVSEPGGESRWMRMWSMSKIVTLVTLLRLKGWGAKPGEALSPEVEKALQGAITRSENCPQRRLVLELQRAAGESPEAARQAVADTLRVAGAEAHVSSEIAAPDQGCVAYLEGQREIADPLASALLLGTSTWRVGDAVRFAQALGSGAYGQAIAARVLGAMREPKGRSREALPSELTAPVDWGAGHSFPEFNPAYKAGWGGTQQEAFLAGQIAVLDLPDGDRAAVAVMFHPDVQPAVDDPGLTAAPEGLGLVMSSLAEELR